MELSFFMILPYLEWIYPTFLTISMTFDPTVSNMKGDTKRYNWNKFMIFEFVFAGSNLVWFYARIESVWESQFWTSLADSLLSLWIYHTCPFCLPYLYPLLLSSPSSTVVVKWHHTLSDSVSPRILHKELLPPPFSHHHALSLIPYDHSNFVWWL